MKLFFDLAGKQCVGGIIDQKRKQHNEKYIINNIHNNINRIKHKGTIDSSRECKTSKPLNNHPTLLCNTMRNINIE